jgi:prepilin-type N-terminal cleavage/methylation domain-containing protein
MNRRGLSLIEVLVVLAILGILLALILPAVQGARESARRVQCTNNLRQLCLAVHQYEEVHGVLPQAMRSNYSFHVALLPHLDQEPLFRQFDFAINATDYQGPLRSVRVPIFECPSDSSSRRVIVDLAATSYFGNCGSGAQRYGYNGVFGYGRHKLGGIRTISSSAITDGTSKTAMFSEALGGDGSYHRLRVWWLGPALGKPEQFDQFAETCRDMPTVSPTHFTENRYRGRPWVEGGVMGTLYNHVLGPNSPSCLNGAAVQSSAFSSASFHRGIVNVAHADGSVHPVSETIELDQWRRLASRAGIP